MAGVTPFARDKQFWRLIGDAVIIGLVGGVLALAFVSVVGFGTGLWWPDDPDYGVGGGEWWWVLVTTGTGIAIGTLRVLSHVPKKKSGALAEIQAEHVDVRTAPQMVGISAISLIGGCSLGPFDAAVRSGGAFGEWYSARRQRNEEMRSINTLSGAAAGVGSLLTAPFVAVLLNVELAKVQGRNVFTTFIPNVVAASIGFAIFYTTVGSSFLDLYETGPYELEAWHLLAAVGLGATASLIMIALGIVVRATRQMVARTHLHPAVLAGLGGLTFGVAGVILPLTMFAGKSQLADAIDQLPTLSAGLLVAVLAVKLCTFAISMATGFIGGP